MKTARVDSSTLPASIVAHTRTRLNKKATAKPNYLILLSSLLFLFLVGRDSSVGKATRYGLDGPGIESLWGRDFPRPSRQPWGPPSLLYNGYRVYFPWVKRPGRGVDHPSQSTAEVKQRVELHLYSPTAPWW
jgi:hypothetical protein